VARTPLPPGGGSLRLVPLAIGLRDPAIAAAACPDADPTRAIALASAITAGIGGGAEREVLRIAGGPPENAVLAGALRGAALGRRAFDPRAALSVLTCRPDAGLGVARPRPEEYWPDDLIDLAEALLSTRDPA
jgi:hypothetical protein